eukprot:CAMPEP_0171088744 /NCGR_PEP_ID=MMETSP0766_2-20121228/20965_1 /TAXON_ID=439317 /ORGANISM="Gambierdiscus australes, Strain CAWD 149" /LENGTH=45 /DNA_ID= /DNA_START= /DNA_END= /DNA_ORIENTATION=
MTITIQATATASNGTALSGGPQLTTRLMAPPAPLLLSAHLERLDE